MKMIFKDISSRIEIFCLVVYWLLVFCLILLMPNMGGDGHMAVTLICSGIKAISASQVSDIVDHIIDK